MFRQKNLLSNSINSELFIIKMVNLFQRKTQTSFILC